MMNFFVDLSSENQKKYFEYLFIGIVIVAFCVILYYSYHAIGGFIGSFPQRSDYGGFDLQAKIDKLIEKQMNNLGI